MDKIQLIKQEIERLKNHTLNIQKTSGGFVTSVGRGRIEAFNDILEFIDSLPEEPASENLEEEIKDELSDVLMDLGGLSFSDVYSLLEGDSAITFEGEDLIKIAEHFYDHQKSRSNL